MPEYSILAEAMQLGAKIVQTVDIATGEILASDSFTPGRAGGGSCGDAGGPAVARGRGGLSNPHICTGRGSANFWVGGGLLNCTKPGEQGEQVGGGKRGKVQGFSPASRRRLLYTFGKIQRAKMPVMVTLTYPAEFPTDSQVWKNHLRRWWQRLKRRIPGAGAVWKLEPQKRGAPHYHLLVWGLEGVPLGEMKAYISKSWFQVVASGDKKHLLAGTRVEPVRDHRGVMSYAGKYLGKVEEEDIPGWQEPGRFWGIKSAECIPWAELVSYPVTMTEAVKLLRLIRRAMKCKRGNLPGLTMLSSNPDFWNERLERLLT